MPEWPEERAQRLRELWGKYNTAEIAKHLGASKNSVIGKAHRLGLPRLESPSIRSPNGPRPQKPRRIGASASLPALPALEAFAPVIAADAGKQRSADEQRNKCCWPMSDGRPWTFCNKPCDGTYCKDHAEMARGTGTASERRADKPPDESSRPDRRLSG